jgi:hypothetical protein
MSVDDGVRGKEKGKEGGLCVVRKRNRTFSTPSCTPKQQVLRRAHKCAIEREAARGGGGGVKGYSSAPPPQTHATYMAVSAAPRSANVSQTVTSLEIERCWTTKTSANAASQSASSSLGNMSTRVSEPVGMEGLHKISVPYTCRGQE